MRIAVVVRALAFLKKRARALVVAGALTPTVIPWSAHTDAFGDRAYLQGIAELDAGHAREALAMFEDALNKNLGVRERDDAHFFAARAALQISNAASALTHMKAIERSMPEVGDLVFAETARAQRAAGQWKVALATWRKLVEKWPESALAKDAAYSIADAYYGIGLLQQAQLAYEAALTDVPDAEQAPTARFNLARIAELQGRNAEAAAAYTTLAYNEAGEPYSDPALDRLNQMIAKKWAPQPTFANQLARFDKLLSRRSSQENHAELERLVGSAPASVNDLITYRTARLAMREHDYKTAIIKFTALADKASGWSQLEYKSWIAKCHMAADDSAAAVRAYKELAEAYSSKAEGREALYKAGWLAFNAGEYATAVKVFGDYLARYGRDRQADEAAWYVAWSLYRGGDLPKAIAALTALRTRFPGSTLVPRSYYWQGRILVMLGRAEEAREAYRQTITLVSLEYYGVLAQQRLAELARDARPVVSNDATPVLLASLDNATLPTTETAAAGEGVKLPHAGVLTAHADDGLSWGNAAFAWDTPTGKRLLRLVSLHFYGAAADVVPSLQAKPGQEKADVAYARARMMYALGDYNAAYRIAAIVFRDEIDDSPTVTNRAYMRLAYPDAHSTLVEDASQEFSVSPLLVLSVMRQESAFDDRARSSASA
ncbi:MAG: tetratricopeptide repeat protein, partial [Clostridia bacterium]|nr:tetratricopeptide repeat protein [Deltaproteobacteria bacterium]